MIDFTPEEHLQIAEALAVQPENGLADAALLPEGAASLFCENWATVKSVLEYLKPQLPLWMRGLVSAVIAAGNLAHGRICPA